MRIAIIGAGGVGGYFGAKLVKAGYDVKFLARGKQLEAISTHGLQVKSILGDFEVKPVTATDKISELGPSELILLAIKAWQIKEVRDHLSEIVDTNTVILPLQNGVLVAEELEKSVNKKRVLGGVCRIISKIEAPGVINHFGATPSIVFGSFDPMKSEELQKIKSAFDQAEIHSSISENINLEIWKKFAFICVGGLMAVTRSTIGELRELIETRTLLRDLIIEICVLADKAGTEMGVEFVDRTVSFIDSLPQDVTFSMARDIWEGRPSELDYLNGTVVALGKRYEVDTPINRFVYGVLKPLELKARS